jgi:hypothetical protein
MFLNLGQIMANENLEKHIVLTFFIFNTTFCLYGTYKRKGWHDLH